LGQSLHGKTAREVQQQVRRTVLIFDVILMKSAMALDVGHVIDDQPMSSQKRELCLKPRCVCGNRISLAATKWLAQPENVIRDPFRNAEVRMEDERTQQLDVTLAKESKIRPNWWRIHIIDICKLGLRGLLGMG